MRKQQAHRLARAIERHACLRVVVIANAVGVLRDLRELPRIVRGRSDPLAAMRASSWLVIAQHAGDRTPILYGWTGDDALLDVVWFAFSRHSFYGLRPEDAKEAREHPVGNADELSPRWRCPVHEPTCDVAAAHREAIGEAIGGAIA